MSYICCISMKRSSLQKRVSKFIPKTFYEIDPWSYPRDKCSSLFGLFISGEEKKFYNIRANRIKKTYLQRPGLNVKNFLRPEFTNFRNKLECLSLASIFSLVQCIWVKARSLP